MSGFSDLAAKNTLSLYTGQGQAALPAAIYLALFTGAPTTDSNTSTATEVSGGSYARQQVAGSLACTAVTASTTITLSANAPAWLTALGSGANPSATGGGGCTVWNAAGGFIGTVASGGASTSSTTLTLTGTAALTGATTIYISAFSAPANSSGSEPTTAPANITNGASVTFPQATASWGNVNSFGLYDSLAATTNLLVWDYLGNFKWIPFTGSAASPCVITVDNTGDAPANGSSIVVTQKYGGTLPTLSGGSWTGVLTTAGLSGATFDISGNNASAIGGGQFRQVLVQAIAINVTASFAGSTLTVSAA